MTLNEVKELIELVAKKGFAEFEIAHADFKLKIVANAQPATHVAPSSGATVAVELAAATARPVAPVAPVAAPEAPAAGDTDDASLYIVKSPIVGTFYRASSPTAEPFARVGDRVDVGAVLCIVEAMKLMNEIEAERAGEIVKVFVDNGQPVEYGQPLFGIRQ
ncbi:MAG TPA: acetyl-CoA carboxylase biotin carboxyl carrier protein [Blastocatellia bacterium]|nr:acetyl-CoA carboxylase biotin carboxyl carrier protein [Blastocatellia bacterium]